MEQSPLNRVAELGLERIYDPPLVGLAHACDPLYRELKTTEVIGITHMSPKEWLPEAETVISYFLPFSAPMANHTAGLPAPEWLFGRIEGEACNTGLRQFLIEEIGKTGGKALAPTLDARFSIINKVSEGVPCEHTIPLIYFLFNPNLTKLSRTKSQNNAPYSRLEQTNAKSRD